MHNYYSQNYAFEAISKSLFYADIHVNPPRCVSIFYKGLFRFQKFLERQLINT